jgi:2-polyprenyl-3-methyl-5-hydroxy-6-metoxy-1,4-benzoquinol methylase
MMSTKAMGNSFEERYIELREKEHRVHTDEELRKLPEVSSSHPYYNEWKKRKQSCRRLIKYLGRKKMPLQLLEIGSGNGWLAAQLANGNIEVTGIDINLTELEQARRVFAGRKDLHFVYGDLRDNLFENRFFDVIVFASSIQYFPSLKEILKVAMKHLSLSGEIHIMDSPFYDHRELAAAKQRTEAYFNSMGSAGIKEFYFHHDIAGIRNFNPRVLYDPASWSNMLRKKKNPFYHFIIGNNR